MSKNQTQQNEYVNMRKQPACALCKAFQPPAGPPPKCNGHGVSGGGGSSSESEEMLNKTKSNPANTSTTTGEAASSRTPGSGIPRPEPSNRIFDEEVIKELLNKGYLTIQNVGQTLNIQCELFLLTSEQKSELNKFIGAIKNEFEKFKKDDPANTCIERNEDNKLSLTIKIPKFGDYNEFIQRLLTMGSPQPSLQTPSNTDVEQVKKNGYPLPTPLPTSFKPPGVE